MEQFSKRDEINWNFCAYTQANATLTVTPLNLSLAIADLYEDVTFPTP